MVENLSKNKGVVSGTTIRTREEGGDRISLAVCPFSCFFVVFLLLLHLLMLGVCRVMEYFCMYLLGRLGGEWGRDGTGRDLLQIDFLLPNVGVTRFFEVQHPLVFGLLV